MCTAPVVEVKQPRQRNNATEKQGKGPACADDYIHIGLSHP